MSVYFVTCTVETVKYRDYVLRNNPINLALCFTISKNNYTKFPDTNGIPAIYFNGNEVWVYDDEKQRDKDFEAISNIRKV